MPTLWTEDQVTLPNLASHFEDSGLHKVTLLFDRIKLFTPSGICYGVTIDDGRKFLRIGTDLPTDRTRSRDEKLELIQRLNSELFMCSFSLDRDDDLVIDYSITYQTGLIIGQLMLMLNRFSSMVEHVVESMNEDGLIRFGQDADENQSDINESVQLDASCPKGVVLN